jgi:hypothetical protein
LAERLMEDVIMRSDLNNRHASAAKPFRSQWYWLLANRQVIVYILMIVAIIYCKNINQRYQQS